jgi:RNA methyltransferase, TrmH family
MFIFIAVITAAEIRFIKSLKEKKNRTTNGLFVVEGNKSVVELIKSDYSIHSLYAISEWLSGIGKHPAKTVDENKIKIISSVELERISLLEQPTGVIAIAQLPQQKNIVLPANEIIIALDNIQDPGNLGSMIRTADWFGVTTILCSNDTVDAFSHKVVQASMGSLFRTNIFYVDLVTELKKCKAENNIPVYATMLSGKNLYETNFSVAGVLLMGNEGKGISEKLLPMVQEKIFIPCFSKNTNWPESLNVGAALAVCLGEITKGVKKPAKSS